MLARARAFVFYFNTERNAVYCVLYVFLFILYNTVFFITQPCSYVWLASSMGVYGAYIDRFFYRSTELVGTKFVRTFRRRVACPSRK